MNNFNRAILCVVFFVLGYSMAWYTKIWYSESPLNIQLPLGLSMDKNKKIHDTVTTIQELRDIIKQFVVERDWTQYHTPKNLSMSIAIEAAELMEKFQFVESDESFEIVKKHKQEVAHELVDILGYVLNFANACDIDLSSYCVEKIALNAKKYPVDVAKGSYGKYTKLGIFARKK